MFVGLVVVLLWIPGHHPSSDGIQTAAAAIGTIYVLGLSVVAPRFVRGLVLRAGGAQDPIVLLGRGVDPIGAETIRARWRLAAVAASTIVSLAGSTVAAVIALLAAQESYGHALAAVAFGASLAVGAAVLVPAPGFLGWALALGLVDAFGVASERRVLAAARIAQGVGAPLLMALGTAGALLGDPLAMILGFMLALVTWTRADLAAGQDAAVRFLACHTAGDVSRPITSHVAPDQSLDDLLEGGAGSGVTLVEDDRGAVGAIGPRQIGSRGLLRRQDERSDSLMVPLAAARLIGELAPAADVLPELARNGFALVRGSDGLGYVESTALSGQIRVWLALKERRNGRKRESNPEEEPVRLADVPTGPRRDSL